LKESLKKEATVWPR